MKNSHDMARNSFIRNVNLLAKNIEQVKQVNQLYTEEQIDYLIDLAKKNIDALMDDLEKGSLSGHRKLDINLLTNFKNYNRRMTQQEMLDLWNDPTQQVYYSGITVWFTDRTILHKEFTEVGVPFEINNHAQLYHQLRQWPEFQMKYGMTMFNLTPDTFLPQHELIRIWDGEGTGSFIERIQLHVAPSGQNQNYDSSFAGAKDYSPQFTWIYTTSTLEVIAQSLNQLLVLSGKVDDVVMIINNMDELTAIYAVLDKLASNNFQDETIHKNLAKLDAIYRNLAGLLALGDVSLVIEKIEKEKANIIVEDVPVGYDLSFTMPPRSSNQSENYVVGDILTSDPFSFRVTDVTTEGKILNGVLTPTVALADVSGNYIFQGNMMGSMNTTPLLLNIIATPKLETKEVRKDLIDVYMELKDRATEVVGNVDSALEELERLTNIVKILENQIAQLELGGGSGNIVDMFVRKESSTPQTINSDLVMALNRRISALKSNGATHPLIQGGRVTTQVNNNALVRDTVQVGSTSEHLNLQTGNDPIYAEKVTVTTPSGTQELVYVSELANEVAINFLLGSCIPMAADTFPEEAKVATGAVYLIADYPDAGAVLGSKYGGDGVTTFGTPDLRNQPPTQLTWVIVLGKDSGSSTRLYCGRTGVYCGRPGMYPGMKVTW